MAAEDREGVKSLVKALDILECVADSPDGAGCGRYGMGDARLDPAKQRHRIQPEPHLGGLCSGAEPMDLA